MQHALRLLLVSDHAYLPDRTGGKEVSTHEIATQYARDGHEVTVLTSNRIPGYRPGTISGIARYARSHLQRRRSERQLEYRVLRSGDVQRSMRDLLSGNRYDLTILQFAEPHLTLDFDLPPACRYIVYIRDVRKIESMTAASFPTEVALVANSGFTARAVAGQTGRDVPTIVPFVDKPRYMTKSEGPFVTFINPVPIKGLELAFEIAAACPELPFLFVEGWPLSGRTARKLLRRIRRTPNIRFHRRVADMRPIYRRTRVLIAPSRWAESWGRVVTESHFSAIPVLASRIGGLPESVGCGGILVPPEEPAPGWAEALREIYAPTAHGRYATLARVQAEVYWSRARSIPAALLACAPGDTEPRPAPIRISSPARATGRAAHS